MLKFSPYIRACAIAAAGAALSAGGAHAQLDRALQIAQQSTEQGIQNQTQVENLDDQRSDLAREYRALLQQIESQRLFVDQQEVFLRSQQNEIENLNEQLGRVEDVTVELLPMMRQMVTRLEEFIRLDLPFQLNERLDRIARLQQTMDNAEISEAERYRVILNAYEIEASYGRGIDAYEGPLEEGGNDTVDFLRFGRMMLVYRTKDDSEYGYWDRETESWQPLQGDFGVELRNAFRIAADAAAPEVLLAPVPGPVAGEANQAAFEAPAAMPEPEPAAEPAPAPAPAPAAPPAPPEPPVDEAADGEEADAEE